MFARLCARTARPQSQTGRRGFSSVMSVPGPASAASSALDVIPKRPWGSGVADKIGTTSMFVCFFATVVGFPTYLHTKHQSEMEDLRIELRDEMFEMQLEMRYTRAASNDALERMQALLAARPPSG